MMKTKIAPKFARTAGAAALTFALVLTGSAASGATELVNPNDVQRHSIALNTASYKGSVKPGSGRGAVLSGSKKKNVASKGGYFRVSYSTGVSFNSSYTTAKFAGESQNIWKGSKTPSAISLSDKVTADGINISVSLGSGISAGISATSNSIKWKTSAKKRKTIAHSFEGWKLSGLITKVSESASGTVRFGSTSYSTQAG